jgi:hypothetical protein
MSFPGNPTGKAGCRHQGRALLKVGMHHLRFASTIFRGPSGVKVSSLQPQAGRDVAARMIRTPHWMAGAGRVIRTKQWLMLN